MQKLLPFLVAALLAVATPSLAPAQLGKGGKGGGGSGGGNSGGGAPPPTRGGGGGSGGGKTGGGTPPPTRGGGNSGGQNNNGGGGLGRGGGNSGGNGGSRSNGGSTSGNSGSSRSPGGGAIGTSNRQGNSGGDFLGRSGGGQSRSGSVRYSDSNNQISRTRQSQDFGAPPPIVRNDNRSTREAWAEDRVDRNRYRDGYYQYNQRWRDDWYWYPHYQFTYNPRNCVPSPWYSYANVPGYISTVRINFDWIQFEWTTGSRYNWRYNDYDRDWGWSWGSSNRRSDLDYAVDDIYDAFRRGQVRYMDSLIGNDWISVELGRNVQYRLRGDDFYDLLRDVVEGTWTLDYRIREVRQDRGRATIIADHVYRDPWGRQRTSRHYYGLEEGRRGYEIVAFRIDE